MRTITVIGKSKKITTGEIRLAARFFAEILLSPKHLKRLNITISYDKDDAICSWNGWCMQSSANDCYIWIRKSMSRKRQIEVLAHEMVHVKQLVMGEICPETLQPNSPALQSLAKLKMHDSDDYWDNPVEIEANGRTPGLVYRYNAYYAERK